MKKIIYLTFILLTISCKEISTKYDKNTDKQNVVETAGESKKSDIDYSEISQVIQGVWLPKEYLEDIYQSKSAFVSSKFIPAIAELQIDPNNIINDSLEIISSLNNHEGYGFKIWFTKKNNEIIINSDVNNIYSDEYNFEFLYSTKPDTTLNIIKKDKSNKIVGTNEFLRVRNADYISSYGGRGYEYVARKLILEGKFQILDSTQTKLGNIEFNAETGDILNFKYDKYSFLTDFSEPIYEGDHIFLKNKKNEREFERLVVIKRYDTIFLDKPIEYYDGEVYGEKLNYHKYYLIKN
jgi:hypothetical protein